ncbi:Uncharacterised protein [Legionella donaldsonii]|uniref:Uncharacterized protein n=1 Tax=Legionella donaldsonii TaxID=45060 RepID=A0A378KK33_9GAMM|nr:hypothetical protein [Legionella donaldsonii]STX84899.1 Uncharacterised protein [Legionella donaldsonii]
MVNKKTIEADKKFWQMNNELINVGATYLSLLLFNENNEIIYSKSSDIDWADEFTTTGLYKHCHLLSEANNQMNLHKNSFTVVWDLYSPQTEEAKALDDIRKYKDITHGIGFCVKNSDDTRIILNIAGKHTDVNFASNVLKKRANIYKELYSFILSTPPHLLSEFLLK